MIEHHGPVRSMKVFPCKNLLATGGDDLYVRLWRIDTSKDTITPFMSSIFGDSVKAITFSHIHNNNNSSNSNEETKEDGNSNSNSNSVSKYYQESLLAAGGGFDKTPHGFVLVWNAKEKDEKFGTVLFAFRARATIKFGKITAIAFSENNDFLFCGDITGGIYCFHLQSESLICKIENHADIVYDIQIHGNCVCFFAFFFVFFLFVFFFDVFSNFCMLFCV